MMRVLGITGESRTREDRCGEESTTAVAGCITRNLNEFGIGNGMYDDFSCRELTEM